MWQALPGWRRRRPRDGTVRSGRARRETLAVKRSSCPQRRRSSTTLCRGAEKPADDSAASGPTKLAMIPKADKGDWEPRRQQRPGARQGSAPVQAGGQPAVREQVGL